jgi:hypothetical protein
MLLLLVLGLRLVRRMLLGLLLRLGLRLLRLLLLGMLGLQ